MKSFKTINRTLALASTTFGLSSAVALSWNISSAQAAIFGVVNITGDVNLVNSELPDPATETVIFSNAVVQVESTNGDFNSLAGTPATLFNLNLTRTSLGNYTGFTDQPFVTFANNISFFLDNPVSAIRQFTSVPPFGNITLLVVPTFTGNFVDGFGVVQGIGTITANEIFNNGSFSATIIAGPTRVLEPATTGALAALGLGAILTKSLTKKKKAKVCV